MSLLSVKNLSKKYRKRQVVKDVSISVNTGEIVGLLGPNGAGKTTSFHMVVGLLPTDDGKIFMNDNDISNLSMDKRARLGIGYLPQESSIFRKLTVEDNIMAILETMGLPLRERMLRLESLLEELDLGGLRGSKAYALSGGERRRLEITRALATRPRFLLLDEPFAGIDPIAVGDIQQIINRLKNKGIGLLITDHNVQETLSITDRAYIINEGQILESGPPEVIVQSATARAVYLGERFRLQQEG